MRIKIDKADKKFSQYIRLRDKMCVRCLSPVQFNDKGDPISHTASHYFGRASQKTRFDVENADCLCAPCHILWGSRDKEEYRNFKIKQLGEKGFKELDFRHNLYQKKDYTMALIIWKRMYEELKREE